MKAADATAGRWSLVSEAERPPAVTKWPPWTACRAWTAGSGGTLAAHHQALDALSSGMSDVLGSVIGADTRIEDNPYIIFCLPIR